MPVSHETPLAHAEYEWLVAGAPGASGPAAVVEQMSERLLAAGIPLHRVAAFVRTLHPSIMGRVFRWSPGQPVTVGEAPYEILATSHPNSPVQYVTERRRSYRARLVGQTAPREYAMLAELASSGFTDYLAAPLHFLNGETHAITFATRAPGGFSDEHVAALERILVPLSRIAEILALTRTAVSLLNAYVGRDAGERILTGKILRGDFDTIRAAIWCSDLRGFTRLAGAVEPGALIGVLNDVFDCQVPAIQRHGGQVLKFIGDGLLAIFPLDAQSAGDCAAAAGGDGDDEAAKSRRCDDATRRICDGALEAAAEAMAAIGALNEKRAAAGQSALRIGLALHVGEVAYGNIGGAARLDFTCIGRAVNLASRLEGLTSRLGRPVVASADFARLTTRAMKPAGRFDLKGIADPQEVFAFDEGPLASW